MGWGILSIVLFAACGLLMVSAGIEDVRKKVEYDLAYIEQRSIWFDLKIMAMTLPVMLFRRGAH